MAVTRSPRPGELEGEPWEVAKQAIEAFARALRELSQAFEETEAQVRNARMTDAVELGQAGLLDNYPEALEAFTNLTTYQTTPDEDPYTFWTATRDAELTHRIKGALGTTQGLTQKLLEEQPDE
jgi:hypothetical protein